MKAKIIILILVAIFAGGCCGERKPPEIKIKILDINDSGIKEVVYLNSRRSRYAVVYMQDGSTIYLDDAVSVPGLCNDGTLVRGETGLIDTGRAYMYDRNVFLACRDEYSIRWCKPVGWERMNNSCKRVTKKLSMLLENLPNP